MCEAPIPVTKTPKRRNEKIGRGRLAARKLQRLRFSYFFAGMKCLYFYFFSNKGRGHADKQMLLLRTKTKKHRDLHGQLDSFLLFWKQLYEVGFEKTRCQEETQDTGGGSAVVTA